MRRRPYRADPVEILEPEVWETDSLEDGDWRIQTGCDGRRSIEIHDEEDEK